MLNKQMCQIAGVNDIEACFVNLIDGIDDLLETKLTRAKRADLLCKKQIVEKLRDTYYELTKN